MYVGGVLLVVLDCRCACEVSQRVLCWEVASRVFGVRVLLMMLHGMWLGGVGRDVFGGVLWRGFVRVMGLTHPHPNLANSIRLRKKRDTMSCYLGPMLV